MLSQELDLFVHLDQGRLLRAVEVAKEVNRLPVELSEARCAVAVSSSPPPEMPVP